MEQQVREERKLSVCLLCLEEDAKVLDLLDEILLNNLSKRL